MDTKNEKSNRNKDSNNSEENSGQILVEEDIEFLEWYFSPQSEEEVKKYENHKRQVRESQKRHPELVKKAQKKYRSKKHGKTE